MEKFAVVIITAVMVVALLRLLTLPIRFAFKLGIYWLGGLVCLWLLRSISVYTGLYLPINLATVLIAGIFGAPGIGMLALLSIL